MASDEKTHTYEETVSKTSDPETPAETSIKTTETTTPSSEVQTYEVKAVSPTEEEESVSAAGRKWYSVRK